ncbi:nucleoporin domain-containing protein [Hirsutella rhossiliensis]|uniref:Nuclear pore complex protein Nup85 n=1 Tax=Hirsutella rhossiliensis TaxID=111463 RepID=A0A9P8MZE6_9HYPO|nr:nucleoporin domain-containing protein [Hirsutella rhossiliensis]KAH0963802.1 nucleoporin domain-containing protein [Hirsutella rhossiliensis]
MAHRFIVDSSPPSSPAPSTPDRRARHGLAYPSLPDNPSTTPAGPIPSSVASYTPSGAPSDQYLGSSMMRGMAASKPLSFGSQSQAGTGRSLFGRSETPNASLGRSVRARERQPSALSRQFIVDDQDPDQHQQDEDSEPELPPHPGSLFRMSTGPSKRDEDPTHAQDVDDFEAELEKYIDQDVDAEAANGQASSVESLSRQGSEEGDMFLNMRHDDRPYGQPIIGQDEEDMIMLNTPAATSRVRKEAEDIFRRSSARLGGLSKSREFQFATIARDFYTRQDPARITESPDLILKTEALVCRLYEEGVGTEDDAEKMDNSLANVTCLLTQLWNDYVDSLPHPEGEDLATVGPGSQAEPFEKAAFVAQLMLRIHHTRFDNDARDDKAPPPPEVLFDWLQTNHNLYPDQVREIARHKPSPACHGLFWQSLRCALLRGDVHGASQLLHNAGWENVRRGPHGDQTYTGKALENIRRVADATGDMLEQCPAMRSDWDIRNSTWTLFRVQARGSLDKLTLFAEGNLDGSAARGPQSMSAMARKASSQIPWDVYENLQVVYGIVLGKRESIMDTAQDWCEATVGLFGWWDDGSQRPKNLRLSQTLGFGASTSGMARSDDYCDRLASAFHLVLRSDMTPNPINPVEVAIASAFEGNVDAVIGCLRMWSLPVASSVAEIASLGKWLPPTQALKPLLTDALDMEDLALLGVTPPSQDEIEGIKDTTLVLYARELAGVDHLSPQRDGWEMAIQVLGRMDLPEKADETVGELLRDLLETLDENSSTTVDRMWRILNDLGMVKYAEETAETFAQILSKESHRYGEALWYFALAHRVDSVRDVLNLLIAYSLVHSTAYPAEKDLDEELKSLLRKRTDTLEMRAKQDLEAAQLLGRMLSGYATLRKFYEIRDGEKLEDMSASKVASLKKQAAAALVAVISSADDNIRGGLYDESRDAVVSEDFLLALLGEATAFVSQSPATISLEQIDVLLKAIEDIQTVGSRVRDACDDFFNLVLASGQGLKGSTPADLMTKSTSSLSGSSYVMSGSSMLASHLHRSMAAGAKVHRGWDWRRVWTANTKGDDVLRKLRLGLAKDLAALWLEGADGVATF